jgi:hypothetical protein
VRTEGLGELITFSYVIGCRIRDHPVRSIRIAICLSLAEAYGHSCEKCECY